MLKIIRWGAIVLVLLFVALQFFQPEKNKSEITSDHFFKQENVPAHIQVLLSEACLDCHSNNTRYTWYHFVPVAWMVEKHVIEGKDELNFSEWGKMDMYDKITLLEEASQEIKRESMPLKSYKIVHPKAKLSEDQITELCDWTTKLSEELLAQLMAE